MDHPQATLQNRETVNAQTARQFHLNAIDHLDKPLGHAMDHQQAALQDREIVNAQTAHQFHLNAIDHLEKALAFHRDAMGNHDQGDFTTAAQNTTLAQTHVGHASEHTAYAVKHYCEQMVYKYAVSQANVHSAASA